MVLENKLGIQDASALAREEERLSKKRALELFDNKILDKLEAGTFKSLQEIHRYLFQDIYDFAGLKPDFLQYEARLKLRYVF